MALRLAASRLPALRPRPPSSLVPSRSLGASPAVPPFARNKPPSQMLHEEHELVWDDGVAPELTLDFDAQHIPKREGLLWWLGGLGFFAGLAGLVALTDPAGKNPAVNRTHNMIPEPLAKGLDEKRGEE